MKTLAEAFTLADILYCIGSLCFLAGTVVNAWKR